MVRKYERVRNIGCGRFGSTILVQATGCGMGASLMPGATDVRLAIMKTIDAGRLCGGDQARLLQEIRELASFRHPHIVPVLECFRDNSIMCLVTAYAGGGDVAGRVFAARRSGGGLKDEQVLQWLAQALLALEYIHRCGALHRDLRARRLLLTAKGEHVLVSGVALSAPLAKALDAERPDVEAMRYLGPELVGGQECHSRASDIWAMGVILYEMLCLRPPFEHSRPRALAEKIAAKPVPALPPRCPEALSRLCAALLCREPGARPSAERALREPAVQARLRSLLNEEPTEPPPRHVLDSNADYGVGPAPALSPRLSPLKLPAGTLLMKAPVVTPRALRQAGAGRWGKEQAWPKAALTPRALTPMAPQASAPPRQAGPARGSPPASLFSRSSECFLVDELALPLSPRSPRSPLSPLPGRVTSDMADEVASTVVAEVVESLDLSPDRLL